MPEVDWVARFREGFRPFRVGRFEIVPCWETAGPAAERLIVDPGRAFGTGTHETTKLCLEALESLADRRPLGRTLDLGAGTALLAVAARRLGAGPVVASDIDPEATAASQHHAALNGERLHVVRADGACGFRTRAFDLVLANLMALAARRPRGGDPGPRRARRRARPLGPAARRRAAGARGLRRVRHAARAPARRVGRARLRTAGARPVSLHRFHVPSAAPGARVELPEHAAHHAREVLRLRAGAEVHVFDGAGHEWHAVLDEVSRRSVSARMLQAVTARAESPLRLVLAMAALKGDRMELVLQKATELGVAAIWPVVTFRTDAAARPALEGSRAERWERVASGAAEQCGRAHVPQVAPTTTLRGPDRAACSTAAASCCSRRPATHRSRRSRSRRHFPAAVARRPRRRLRAGEAEELRAAGFAAASLGPRILRAETAAVAAVAIAQSRWGDLAP